MSTTVTKRFGAEAYSKKGRLNRELYEEELLRLQIELVKLQEWVKHEGERVVVLFEGRDAAGKGGVIKRITASTNPRIVRVVALGKPSDREQSQWYFQRYVEHLPAAGEMVLFDRSWYNRAGVERVMGFATQEQVDEFMRSCPTFERMLIRSGIRLIKYWFSVSDEEQERRFQARLDDPTRRWKLSPMAARLNCISHLLSQIPYQDLTPDPLELPPRPPAKGGYVRPPLEAQTFVPEIY
jgi:polyphosphate kinase 2